MLLCGMDFTQSLLKLPLNQVLFHFLNAVLNAQMQHNNGGLSVDQCLTPVTCASFGEVHSCTSVSMLQKYRR